MKRIIITMFAAICFTAAFGQAKTNVAVYVHGNANEDEKKVIAQRIIANMVKSNEYAVVERTAEFLAELKREQGYQYSGNVDDGQIIKLGKQFGVKLVCVADVQRDGDYYLIATRMVNVETGLVVSAAGEYNFYYSHPSYRNHLFEKAGKKLWSGDSKTGGLIAITDNVVARLLQGMTTTKGKQKIAIYVTKSSDTYTAKCVSYELIENITNSEIFITVDRTSDFRAELRYQGSGNVDDSQLSKLGRQFGVGLVCIIDITDIYTTMRILNVETGLIVATAENQSSSEVDKMTTELMQQLVQNIPCIKTDQKITSKYIKCCEGLVNIDGVCRDQIWLKNYLGIEANTNDLKVREGTVLDGKCSTCPEGWRLPTKAEFEKMLTIKEALNLVKGRMYLTSDFVTKTHKSTIYYEYYVWNGYGFLLKTIYSQSGYKKKSPPPPYYYSYGLGDLCVRCVKD